MCCSLWLTLVQLQETAATDNHKYCASNLISPFTGTLKCIYTQSRGVTLTHFITFVLILLESCCFLLSDNQLSVTSIHNVSLALASDSLTRTFYNFMLQVSLIKTH